MPGDLDVLIGRRVELYLDAREDALDRAGFHLTKGQACLMNADAGNTIELRDQEFDFTKIDGRYSKIDAVLIQSRTHPKPYSSKAVLIQSRGSEVQDDTGLSLQCERCVSEKGPFKFCIRLSTYEGGIGCCGNCRWHDQASLCDFYVDEGGDIFVAGQSAEHTQSTRSGREVKKPARPGLVENLDVPEVVRLRTHQNENRVARSRSRESRHGLTRRGGNLKVNVSRRRIATGEEESSVKVETT